MSQIGKNVKKIRNVRGLSQQAFADLFQLTRGNISSYEEFRAEPKLDVMLRIAKYFCIPLADLIEKDLSVNELLHYNTELVLETEKLKLNQQVTRIPYIPLLYINDFASQYKNEDFIHNLPHLVLPGNARFKQIALEVDNQEALPAGFDFHAGDILIYEQVVKENAHRIVTKLGMMANDEGIKTGVYKEQDKTIILSLNDWIHYPFDMDSDNQYWVLKALYTQK
jgi:transcriptional regulator with XRE-family HTH domain